MVLRTGGCEAFAVGVQNVDRNGMDGRISSDGFAGFFCFFVFCRGKKKIKVKK